MKRRLTERIIASLRTDKKQQDVFHTPTPSAGLRLTREGRKTWFALYRSPVLLDAKGQPKLRRYYFGEHRSGKAGQGECLTLEEFRKAYEIFRGALARGIDPQEKTGEITGGETRARVFPVTAVPEWLRPTFPVGYTEGSLSHMLCLYFEAIRTGTGIRKLAPRTLNCYTATAKTHVIRQLGVLPATGITQDCISDLFSEIAKKSPQVVRQVKKVLSGILPRQCPGAEALP